MLGLTCRYACYYLTRNSLTYTAPVMVSDPSLKMDITQVLVLVNVVSMRTAKIVDVNHCSNACQTTCFEKRASRVRW